MSNKKFTNAISGKGYYIALILCAVAIGISGYLYYRNIGADPKNPINQPSLNAPQNGEDVQAGATSPDMDATVPGETTQPESKLGKTAKPVSGEILMGYAMDVLSYNQTTRDWRVHNGIDIAAKAGTAVCAAADGVVYTVYEDDTMGTTVVITHNEGYITKYASLSPEVSVSAGDSVTCGQTIGTVGNTALLENALGDHVHFSVTCNDKQINPEDFFSQE